MLKTILLTIVLSLTTCVSWGQDATQVTTPAVTETVVRNIVQELRDVSVTIKAGSSQGSGILVTRKVGDNTVTFVFTAAHVIDSLRTTRDIIDPNSGARKTVIEFKDPTIVKEYFEDGRRIGEASFDTKVVKYSDSENGQDLCVLMIRKKNFTTENVSVQFHLDESIPDVGTRCFHVGSLLGQFGSSSLTEGIISQTGRVLSLGSSNSVVFDQTTTTSFGGSSGGGLYKQQDGQCIGLILRGAGESFTLYVPVRRMKEWCLQNKMMWIMDPTIPMPTLDEISKIAVEDSGVTFLEKASVNPEVEKDFPKLIIERKDQKDLEI
jgi:hypothetical protein